MATRDVTPRTLALADMFRRHREDNLDGITRLEASQRCGFHGDSTYRNIEAGREVSLASYRQAARRLGLPGGPERVEAVFNGKKDPGPGKEQATPTAFHPSATEEAQTLAVLAALTRAAEENRAAIVALSDRVVRLEQTLEAQASTSTRPRKSAR